MTTGSDAHADSPSLHVPPAGSSIEDFAAWARPSLLAMTRLARRLVPEADVDDVVQDALTRAWRKRRHFDPARGTPTTWLLAILADQARTNRRGRIRWQVLVDDAAAVPERAVSDTERDLDLDAAVADLPRRQQLAVQLHYFVGLSVEQTAAVMACSAGTVKSTLFDARTHLRAVLGSRDAD